MTCMMMDGARRRNCSVAACWGCVEGRRRRAVGGGCANVEAAMSAVTVVTAVAAVTAVKMWKGRTVEVGVEGEEKGTSQGKQEVP